MDYKRNEIQQKEFSVGSVVKLRTSFLIQYLLYYCPGDHFQIKLKYQSRKFIKPTEDRSSKEGVIRGNISPFYTGTGICCGPVFDESLVNSVESTDELKVRRRHSRFNLACWLPVTELLPVVPRSSHDRISNVQLLLVVR